MRIPIFLSIAVALSGCVEGGAIQDTEAVAKIKAACSAGDVQACQYIATQDEQRRLAAANALSAMGRSMQQSGSIANTYWAPQRTQTTRCQPEFGQVVCRTY